MVSVSFYLCDLKCFWCISHRIGKSRMYKKKGSEKNDHLTIQNIRVLMKTIEKKNSQKITIDIVRYEGICLV